MTEVRSRSRSELGVALISFAQLGLELAFVKLAHYEFGTLSLAVIGIALLGVALSAPLTRSLGGVSVASERALFCLPAVAWISGAFLFSSQHQGATGDGLWLRLMGVGVAGLATIALASVPVYVELLRSPETVARTYAASLLGAASGALSTLALLQAGGDATAYAAMLLACAPVAYLLIADPRHKALGMALAVVASAGAALAYPRFDANAHPDALFIATDAISRIEVRHGPEGALRFRTAGVNTGTMTAPPLNSPARRKMTEKPVTLPFHRAPRRVLLLGSGGGRNVSEALDLGAGNVVAVEINGMIPAYMRRELSVADDPYRDPRVSLRVGEGREIAARLSAEMDRGAPRFDLIYVPVATLYGGSGQPVVETYLMTREALSLYLGMVDSDGVVGAFFGVVAIHQMASSFAQALEERGVSPLDHLAAVRYGPQVALLARPGRPYSDEERRALAKTCPGGQLLDLTPEIARRTPPITDDAPYFMGSAVDVDDKFRIISNRRGPSAVLFRSGLGALFVVLAAALLQARPGARTLPLGFAAAFAAMGASYAVLQTVAIQRLGFLLGHPVLGAAAVVPATLVGTAVGARLTARIPERHWGSFRAVSTVVLIALIGAAAFVSPRTLLRPEWSLTARIAIGVIFALSPFVVAGSYFPVVFARLKREAADITDLVWIANGVGAVLGSVFCVYGGMRLGFRATLLVPAALYAALSAWDLAVRRPRTALVGNVGIASALALSFAASTWIIERAAENLE